MNSLHHLQQQQHAATHCFPICEAVCDLATVATKQWGLSNMHEVMLSHLDFFVRKNVSFPSVAATAATIHSKEPVISRLIAQRHW